MTARTYRVQLYLILLTLWLYQAINPAATAHTTMFSSRPTLWALITQLGADVPFTKQKLETRLGIRLVHTARNDYFDFFEGGDIKLANGLVISRVDLRIRHDGQPHPGFLVLTLAGQCVTMPEVRQHYGNLALLAAPRGRSIHETTSFQTTEPWGSLNFAFPETNRECVSTIAFDPKPLAAR